MVGEGGGEQFEALAGCLGGVEPSLLVTAPPASLTQTSQPRHITHNRSGPSLHPDPPPLPSGRTYGLSADELTAQHPGSLNYATPAEIQRVAPSTLVGFIRWVSADDLAEGFVPLNVIARRSFRSHVKTNIPSSAGVELWKFLRAAEAKG